MYEKRDDARVVPSEVGVFPLDGVDRHRGARVPSCRTGAFSSLSPVKMFWCGMQEGDREGYMGERGGLRSRREEPWS